MEYIPAKTIVTRTKNRDWFGTDYNMNIYRGCSHGCIYCDSRSECYGIEDFDRVRAKGDALRIIRDDLRRKVRKGVVGTGSMSDPYNPFENDLCLTRHALELIDAYGFGIAIATKSPLLLRDMDILEGIREHSPVACMVTVTSAQDELAARVEPGAAASSQRFRALAALAERGIFAGVLLMPVLPFLEDSRENVLSVVRHGAEAGCKFIYPFFGMTLRAKQREYYYGKLDKLFPDAGLTEKYRRRYGESYHCPSPKAAQLYKLFAAECEKCGILYRMKDIVHAYKENYGENQMPFPK